SGPQYPVKAKSSTKSRICRRRGPQLWQSRLGDPTSVTMSPDGTVDRKRTILVSCESPGQLRGTTSDHSASRRKRRAFPMTDAELTLIAAAANIGLNSTPKTG